MDEGELKKLQKFFAFDDWAHFRNTKDLIEIKTVINFSVYNLIKAVNKYIALGFSFFSKYPKAQEHFNSHAELFIRFILFGDEIYIGPKLNFSNEEEKNSFYSFYCKIKEGVYKYLDNNRSRKVVMDSESEKFLIQLSSEDSFSSFKRYFLMCKRIVEKSDGDIVIINDGCKELRGEVHSEQEENFKKIEKVFERLRKNNFVPDDLKIVKKNYSEVDEEKVREIFTVNVVDFDDDSIHRSPVIRIYKVF